MVIYACIALVKPAGVFGFIYLAGILGRTRPIRFAQDIVQSPAEIVVLVL